MRESVFAGVIFVFSVVLLVDYESNDILLALSVSVERHGIADNDTLDVVPGKGMLIICGFYIILKNKEISLYGNVAFIAYELVYAVL